MCAESLTRKVYSFWSKELHTERSLSNKAVMTQNLTKNGLFIQSEARNFRRLSRVLQLAVKKYFEHVRFILPVDY